MTLGTFVLVELKSKHALFLQEPFYKNVRLMKSEKFLFWILHKIMETFCFPSNVRQCIIACSIGLYVKHFVFNFFFIN